ncbi:duplicated homeodomain-like superfamily protein [Anaeramoeba flamelloides]|uniref:Duplicated homeodomain-like superfamily protein n=1 Tax=Anaeramoeba flamelloides TaxID=1746091 RepID=A0AAV8A325_9EUKA|nr:duplicated homeodomain-like superfamily protein [Anaeramoeba flamelloides]
MLDPPSRRYDQPRMRNQQNRYQKEQDKKFSRYQNEQPFINNENQKRSIQDFQNYKQKNDLSPQILGNSRYRNNQKIYRGSNTNTNNNSNSPLNNNPNNSSFLFSNFEQTDLMQSNTDFVKSSQYPNSSYIGKPRGFDFQNYQQNSQQMQPFSSMTNQDNYHPTNYPNSLNSNYRFQEQIHSSRFHSNLPNNRYSAVSPSFHQNTLKQSISNENLNKEMDIKVEIPENTINKLNQIYQKKEQIHYNQNQIPMNNQYEQIKEKIRGEENINININKDRNRNTNINVNKTEKGKEKLEEKEKMKNENENNIEKEKGNAKDMENIKIQKSVNNEEYPSSSSLFPKLNEIDSQISQINSIMQTIKVMNYEKTKNDLRHDYFVKQAISNNQKISKEIHLNFQERLFSKTKQHLFYNNINNYSNFKQNNGYYTKNNILLKAIIFHQITEEQKQNYELVSLFQQLRKNWNLDLPNKEKQRRQTIVQLKKKIFQRDLQKFNLQQQKLKNNPNVQLNQLMKPEEFYETAETLELEEKEYNYYEEYRDSMIEEIQPMIISGSERNSTRYLNNNRFVPRPVVINQMKKHLNPWTKEEEEKFVEIFKIHPKIFHKISQHLPNKSTKDVIQFYYLNKTKLKLKQNMEPKMIKKRRNNKQLIHEGDSVRKPRTKPKKEKIPNNFNSQAVETTQNSKIIIDPKRNKAKTQKTNIKKESDIDKNIKRDSNLDKRKEMERERGRERERKRIRKKTEIDTEELKNKNKRLRANASLKNKEKKSNTKNFNVELNTKKILKEEFNKMKKDFKNKKEMEKQPNTILEILLKEKPYKWNKNEISLFIQSFNKYGRNFEKISSILQTKTFKECQIFYKSYRKKFSLKARNKKKSLWSTKEKDMFLKYWRIYYKNWKKYIELIDSKSISQIQYYYEKNKKKLNLGSFSNKQNFNRYNRKKKKKRKNK